MKVKDFAKMQIEFADSPVKFTVHVADDEYPLTIRNYDEIGEYEFDYWEVLDGRMHLYCA